MTITRQSTISKDAETIITYLVGTKNAMERHKRTIRDACHLTDTRRANRVFQELLETELVNDDSGEGILDLTEAGIRAAQALQKATTQRPPQVTTNITNQIGAVENSSVNMIGMGDMLNTPLSYQHIISPPTTGKLPATPVKPPAPEEKDIEKTMDRATPILPSLNDHPLRNGEPEIRVAKGAKPIRSVAVRFLLAFDAPTKSALPIPIMSGDVLGRSKKCTIVLRHDDYISNRHCRFEIQRDKTTNRPILFVEDLGSRNGTIVDDVDAYDGKIQVHHGSRVRIGDTVLVVVEIPY